MLSRTFVLLSLCFLFVSVSGNDSQTGKIQYTLLQSGSFTDVFVDDFASSNVFWGYSVSGSTALAYLSEANVTIIFTDFMNQTTIKYHEPVQSSVSLYFAPCSNEMGTWSFTLTFANNTEPPPAGPDLVTVYNSAISSDLALEDSFPNFSSYFQFLIPSGDAEELNFNFTTTNNNLGRIVTRAALFDACLPNPQMAPLALVSVDLTPAARSASIYTPVQANTTYYLVLTGSGDLSQFDNNIKIFSRLDYGEEESSDVSSDDSHIGLYIIISLGFTLCICLLVVLVIAFFVVKKKQTPPGNFNINDDDEYDLF